jgi:hypothetical protein
LPPSPCLTSPERNAANVHALAGEVDIRFHQTVLSSSLSSYLGPRCQQVFGGSSCRLHAAQLITSKMTYCSMELISTHHKSLPTRNPGEARAYIIDSSRVLLSSQPETPHCLTHSGRFLVQISYMESQIGFFSPCNWSVPCFRLLYLRSRWRSSTSTRVQNGVLWRSDRQDDIEHTGWYVHQLNPVTYLPRRVFSWTTTALWHWDLSRKTLGGLSLYVSSPSFFALGSGVLELFVNDCALFSFALTV